MTSILTVPGQPRPPQAAAIAHPAAAPAPAKPAAAPADPFGPAVTGAAGSRLDDAKKALATMSGVAKSMRRSRSGQARERLRQLLEQVKRLRMIVGDPKTMARQAAKLAKEIADAAKDYTAGAESGGPELPAATAGEANLTSMNGERRMRLTADPYRLPSQ